MNCTYFRCLSTPVPKVLSCKPSSKRNCKQEEGVHLQLVHDGPPSVNHGLTVDLITCNNLLTSDHRSPRWPMSHDEANGNPFAHFGESVSEYRSPGDFYLEPDTVTRSVTINPDDVAHFALDSQFKGLSDGDYYQEPMSMHKACQPYPSFPEKVEVGYSSITSSSLKSAATRRFSQADFPPEAPKDGFFKLEITTFFVITDMPHDVGNLLLDFLDGLDVQVASSLIKPVNHRKFAFKADFFERYVMATIKVRVYWQENKQFAIEFQRRRGDTLVFNSTFQKAVQYARAAGLTVNLRNPQMPNLINLVPPPLPEQQASVLGEADLTPILDMAGHVGMDSIQAEAASQLANLAEDSTLTLELCTPRVFQQVKTLLNNSATEVAYPAARFAKFLVQQQEAAPFIVEYGMLALMLDKVQSMTLSDLVREVLAQAVQVAADQSKAALPQVERKQLADAFGECSRQLEADGNSTIAPRLRSAQMALSLQ